MPINDVNVTVGTEFAGHVLFRPGKLITRPRPAGPSGDALK
jgi:hypothetical protein